MKQNTFIQIQTQNTNTVQTQNTNTVMDESCQPLYFCQYLHCTDLEVHHDTIITSNNTWQLVPRYNFSDEIDYTVGSHDLIIFFPTVEAWFILHVCIARARPTNQTQINNLPCKTYLNSAQTRLKWWVDAGCYSSVIFLRLKPFSGWMINNSLGIFQPKTTCNVSLRIMSTINYMQCFNKNDVNHKVHAMFP